MEKTEVRSQKTGTRNPETSLRGWNRVKARLRGRGTAKTRLWGRSAAKAQNHRPQRTTDHGQNQPEL